MLRMRINGENCISVLPCALNIFFNNCTRTQKVGRIKSVGSSRGWLLVLDNEA